MTEKQKKFAIIVVTIVLALFFLMSSRRASGGTTIVNQQGAAQDLSGVAMPPIDIPRGNGITINIPGLPSFTPYQYSAVSPCMCNGAEISQSQAYQGPLVTFVTNQGSRGPNIYNYTPPPPVRQMYFSGTSGG